MPSFLPVILYGRFYLPIDTIISYPQINHVVTILPPQTLAYTSQTSPFDTWMIPPAIADKSPLLPTTTFLLVHVYYFTILCKKQVVRPASSWLGIYTLKFIFVELLALFFLVGSLYPKFLSRASRSFLNQIVTYPFRGNKKNYKLQIFCLIKNRINAILNKLLIQRICYTFYCFVNLY